MKVLLILFLLAAGKIYPGCEKDEYWNDNTGIFETICAETNQKDSCLYLGSKKGNWARVIENESIIYYLKKENKKWTIVAKGLAFNIESWKQFDIPRIIR